MKSIHVDAGFYALLSGLVFAATVPVRGAVDAAEAKTHTLFVGLDLSVEHNKSFHRVKDVSGSSFVIAANGRPVFLPVNRASHNLKVAHSLKLASYAATVSNLSSARAYTPGNEPRMRRMQEAAAVSAAMQDASSLAMGQFIAAENNNAVVPGDPNALGAERGAAEAAAANRAMNSLQTLEAYQAKAGEMESEITSAGAHRARADDDLAQELFDAIEAKFQIASDVPLNNPYILLVARFREKYSAPSSARNWIYAKSLDPIDSRPQDVHVLQGGFPRGFILEDFQVHLYNRGDEVATNRSPKRVPLTREEAFEYLKIQYIGSHKGETLAPSPAMGQLPADLHKRLSGGEYNRTYFVKVSKDGLAEGAFLDAECAEKLQDAYIQSVVKNIRFKPALDKGKPVDGVAAVNLEKLPL